jgi:hypothetical protein
MTAELSNYLLLASFSMMAIELTIFIQFKKSLEEMEGEIDLGPELDSLVNLMRDMTIDHLLIYTTVYFLAVLLCRYFTVLYYVLLPLQGISLLLDVFVLWKVYKNRPWTL